MQKKTKILAMILASTMIFNYPISAYADEIEDKQQEINDMVDAQNELQGNIYNLQEEQYLVENNISETELNLIQILSSIDSLNTQISESESSIKETEQELEKAKKQESKQYDAMKKRIQFMYERGSDNSIGWVVYLLEQKNITEILNKTEYTKQMYSYDRECLEDYSKIVQDVAELNDSLHQQKSELEEAKNEQETEEQYLEQLISELQESYDDYTFLIEDAEGQISNYQNSIDQKNEEINELIFIQQEAERKAAEEAARQILLEQLKQSEEENESEEDDYYYEDENDEVNSIENIISEVEDIIENDYIDESYNINQDEEVYNSPVGDSSSGQAIADYACQFVGNPYVWGGDSLTNGTDCSGFVHLIYQAFGYSVSRQSYSLRSDGYGVSYENAQPGDIICYDGHVAIYIGDNAIVHASDERSGIKISYNAAYRPIVAVRRII